MSSKSLYRSLKSDEITRLEQQGCSAENWSTVEVKPDFSPQFVSDCHFSGTVRLGSLGETVTFSGGVHRPASLKQATVHNCIIGDRVYIAGVHNYLANYEIGDEVVIENCNRIVTDGETSFGNGTSIPVLNETGGREVPMFDELSAHLAYILALYRHRPKAIEKIRLMIKAWCDDKKTDRGYIGSGSRIINADVIRNVWIGEQSDIEGIRKLEEGSVNSNPDDPVFIGPGVHASHFIVSSGSRVSDSTLIDHCFLGQGVELGKHYSAENSLFFANCAGFHGEACSIFAGPYTVTHHKSTLLIAAYYSFLNAGSGSNQSNHMYKLGPIHQGIVERGSKTTSDSYLLWPAKVGPFTLVMGRHYKNSDTGNLPFSYLIESNDESVLAPAVNLRSVGTIRDAQKWPRRDKRKDKQKIDLINFNLLSPFTIQKMVAGRKILRGLKGSSGRQSEYYLYENCKIPGKALERGIHLYTMGLHKFLGNSLISRLERRKVKNADDLFVKLETCHRFGAGEWVDLAGLLTPKKLVELLLDRIETNNVTSLGAIRKEFETWHKDYYEMEWTWAKKVLEDEFGIPISKFEEEDIIRIIKTWQKAVVDLDELLYEDARKEFALSSQTGFGVDGSDSERFKDFEEVRGEFEKNPAVSAIRQHIKKKSTLGDKWIKRMGG